MSITHTMTRIIAGALLSGGVAAAGVGLATGTAWAWGGPYTWCPGQSMDDPSGPNRYGNQYAWDMNVCHTWYRVDYGYGNVPRIINGTSTLQGSSAWDGDNPPPPNPSGVNCGLFWCPVPPHYDPNFHG
ncbi:hypothetical protein [Mycobacterium fragae]|uniref:Secreted protein n=1 Tax=Mycobacterium fragae TaxID=1260918 RepID=A0A1X1UJW9_9MYCO|nr:hypothetical protein [Mycobacterium fragae]ORV57126.1 hypothetical protein AWC06_02865 [Mycobacterium fragae]